MHLGRHPSAHGPRGPLPWAAPVVVDAWRQERALHMRDAVAALNRDYRTSLDEFPAAMLPVVETFATGTGRSPATSGASSSVASRRHEGAQDGASRRRSADQGRNAERFGYGSIS
jgi:hypothetical protein